VSCPSASNCSAVGQYLDQSRHTQVFVVSEVHGSWHQAEEVPGGGALSIGGFAQMSVSCPSAGNCSAGGYYLKARSSQQVFVVNKT
jgi:hypothetical protein